MGTVTFVFSDIEGSTRLEQQLGPGYAPVLERQQQLVREAVDRHGGAEVSTEGDAFFLAFADVAGAVAAGADIQRALAAESWPGDVAVRLRVGIHTGQGIRGGDNYIGLDVNRAARLAAAGHGGQVLVSDAARGLLQGRVPDGVELFDLGEHELRDLAEPMRIFQATVRGLPAEFAALRTITAASHLPAQLSSFVGREAELDAVGALLGSHRLVTLTGPGGTGKTRLGLAVAAASSRDFPDGVYFVPLASLTDPALVAPTIAESLDIRASGAQQLKDALREHLRGWQALLLLDNFEQLVEAAPMVGDLLAAAPRLKILVTTRAALRLRGEQEYAVPPLPVPQKAATPDLPALLGFAAVRLFVERARDVRPGFEVNDENAAAVVEICRRLDGLPLAIELAAARLRLLSPQAILDRLGSRLDLLASGARDLPERQRTLRGAIGWSYDLLTETERAFFRRLALFAGGASIEDIEGVCLPSQDLGSDVLELLGSLADKSLLRVEEVGPEPRASMIETIRDYAIEQLAADPLAGDLRCRHGAWFRDLAERAAAQLTGPQGRAWIDRLKRDDDNLRAALRWSLEGGPLEDGLRTLAALWRFWQLAARLTEARAWSDELLAATEGRADLDAAVLGAALTGAGGITYWQLDWDAALALYQRSRAIAQASSNKPGVAEAESNIGYTLAQKGELVAALEHAERAETLMRELGDPLGVAVQEVAIAFIANTMGDLERAGRQLDRAEADFIALGDRFRQGDAATLRGAVAIRGGDDAAARRFLGLAFDTAIEIGATTALPTLLEIIGVVAVRAGRLERGLHLQGAALAGYQRAGGGMRSMTVGLPAPREAAAGLLPEEAIARLVAEGMAMAEDEAAALARAEFADDPQPA
jgi:predicted ATPase/class 3 adenylate cyclase